MHSSSLTVTNALPGERMHRPSTTETRREKRRDGKHNKQEESSERKSRVINTTRAVSSPLSRPECAFVTAAHSSSRVQSMTTCQASITSKLGTTSCVRPEPLIERYAQLEKNTFIFSVIFTYGVQEALFKRTAVEVTRRLFEG